MNRRSNSFRFIPQLVRLEDRLVPAGNVTTRIVTDYYGARQLFVEGDAQGNCVKLNGKGVAGQVEVKGIDTTINGGTKAVLFQNIDQVWVDTADGNDSVRAEKLNVPYMQILLGGGDDEGEINDFTRQGAGGSLVLAGDDSNLAYPGINGNDVLTVAHTRVDAADTYFVMGIYPDLLNDTPVGGCDIVKVKDTEVSMTSSNPDAGSYFYGFGLETWGGISASGPGDDFTISNLNVNLAGPGSMASYMYLNGTSGSDSFHFNNLKMTTYTEVATYMDFFVDMLPWAANAADVRDSIELTNVDIALNTPGAVSGGAQLWSSFIADTVRLRNVSLVGGDLDGSGDILSITGTNVDVHNLTLSSNGWGLFGVGSIGGIGGPADQDTTINLFNVDVSAKRRDGTDADTYIFTEGGNDCVTIKNCSLANLHLDLGAGDDQLELMHSILLSAQLIGGDGNDRLKLRDNTGAVDYLEFESVV